MNPREEELTARALLAGTIDCWAMSASTPAVHSLERVSSNFSSGCACTR